MPLSLSELQTVKEIAEILYDYLPGSAHPYADQSISFPGVVQSVDLTGLWPGGSKLPAITSLLERTLETRREKFCDLMVGIVRKGLIYRENKGNPITREEIRRLNELITKVQFKIPELWDPSFLDSLPSSQPEEEPEQAVKQEDLDELKSELIQLEQLEPVKRGFAFENFLKKLFSVFRLSPRSSFRLVGEQIDGSLQLGDHTYLIEAKWHKEQIGLTPLVAFRDKVKSKSDWSRGVFISYSGFTNDGLEAFSRGRSTNIIGINGQDIYFILEGQMSLVDVIQSKARWAAETGKFYKSVFEIGREK